MKVKVGTAGWTIPAGEAGHFPSDGSSLERYADRFPAVEINSSFHRPHLERTWIRWHDAVPRDFKFAVKMPKEITHRRKLVECQEPLDAFVRQVSHLKEKLGVILVQLPPKLEFATGQAQAFLELLTAKSLAHVACEPRHPSWFDKPATDLLDHYRIARVAADPAITDQGKVPGAWDGLHYWRLHGSPIIYRSSYVDRIPALAEKLEASAPEFGSWCMFDNTASSAATGDALALQRALAGLSSRRYPD